MSVQPLRCAAHREAQKDSPPPEIVTNAATKLLANKKTAQNTVGR